MWCRFPSLFLLVAAGCTAPSSVPAPAGVFVGHPWAVVHGELRIEARYYVDQARIFGGDLPEEYHLLPVALRLGRVGQADSGLLALPDDMNLVLHLADGTTLGRVPPEQASVRRRRMERLLAEGFQGGVVPAWERAGEGFVYFALPADLRVDSPSLRCVRRMDGGTRSLDLGASLVTFELVLDGEPRTLAVGLEIDRRGGARE